MNRFQILSLSFIFMACCHRGPAPETPESDAQNTESQAESTAQSEETTTQPEGTTVSETVATGVELACTDSVPSINFEIDSEELRPESRPILSEIASSVSEDPNAEIRLIGRYNEEQARLTGERAITAANLAQRRAESVREFLIEQGVDGERITVRIEMIDEDPLPRTRVVAIETCLTQASPETQK